MAELVKGNWPHLHSLLLSNDTSFSSACGQEILLRGNWPVLMELWIQDHNVMMCKLKQKLTIDLSMAEWPQLEFLYVAGKCKGMAQANHAQGFDCLHELYVDDMEIEPDLFLPCLTTLWVSNKQTGNYLRESAARYAPALAARGWENWH